jgi:hypothetical protein
MTLLTVMHLASQIHVLTRALTAPRLGVGNERTNWVQPSLSGAALYSHEAVVELLVDSSKA